MGKSGLPFIKHFPSDMATDAMVQAMTCLEFGAYIRLRDAAWVSETPCSLADDDALLSGIARLTDEEWSKAKRRVLAGWRAHNGRLFDPRLETLWQEAREIGKVRAEAGSKGGKQTSSKRVANAKQMLPKNDRVSEYQSNADDDARSRVPDEGPPRTVFVVLCQQGFPPNWAHRAARQFSHFTPDRVEEAIRYIDGKYPGKTLDHRCALLTTCLNEEWKIELVPDTKSEDAAREKRLAELRAKREAKEKARQVG